MADINKDCNSNILSSTCSSAAIRKARCWRRCHFKVAEWSFWGGLAIGYAVTVILALAAHYLIEMRWR